MNRAALLVLAIGVALLMSGNRSCGVVPTLPPPIDAPGYNVLIVEETADRGQMTEDQVAILTSVQLRTWIDQQPGTLMILDDDAPIEQLAKPWQEAMKRPRASLPWLIVSNGQTGWEGPLPADVAATQAVLEAQRVPE